jgi:adenosylcobyric acid synthase
MLGKILFDPDGVEGAPATVEGLGLLDVDTVFAREKKVTPWQGMHIASAAEVSGYEIHMGVTAGGDTARPLFSAAGGMEGACSVDGRVAGTYIHGLFANDGFRRAWLQSIGAAPAAYAYRQHMQRILDEWADTLEASVAIDRLLALSQPV